MRELKQALLAAAVLATALCPGLQKPAAAKAKAFKVTIKKKALRPTVLSAVGARVSLSFQVTSTGGAISRVDAQSKLDKGATSAVSPLAKHGKTYQGTVNVSRNLIAKVNHASIFLIVTSNTGKVVRRQVGRVSLAAGDNSLPPPPPP